MNENGHPESLVAAHPGNQNRLVHGVYSTGREVSPQARQIVENLRTLPTAKPIDEATLEEVAKLLVVIDRIDVALADGRTENRAGRMRELLDIRRRYSQTLRGWYEAMGVTPAARAAILRDLLSGRTLAQDIAKTLDEVA